MPSGGGANSHFGFPFPAAAHSHHLAVELAVDGCKVVGLECGRNLRPVDMHAEPVDARDGKGFVEVAVLDRPGVGPYVDPAGGGWSERGSGQGK